MTRLEAIKAAILAIIETMDDAISGVVVASEAAQKKMYEIVLAELQRFEIADGRLVRSQTLSRRIARIEKALHSVLSSDSFTRPIAEYFSMFTSIDQRNIAMQKTFNQIAVDAERLAPARKYVLALANRYLGSAGLNDAYVQPAKYLIMQQVVTGASITEAKKMLERWDSGELTDGRLTAGRQTPNLQRYATQLARDTAYQYNGTVQQIIRTDYKLDSFIYAGDIIEDTRPLCRHLVQMDQPIKFDLLPDLIAKYPQGVIPGTNEKNFQVYRGGYNCRHVAYPVRGAGKK